MTGTADTEAYEFRQIYGLDVVVIPTNVPVKRIDHNDLVYMTMEEKFEAIVADVIAERESRSSPCWSAQPQWRRLKCSLNSSRRKGFNITS